MQSWFVTHRKKLEEVDFVDEEFLHKKVNKKWRLYVDCGVLQKIFQKIATCTKVQAAWSQALWRFDSIELKEVTKVLQLCFS